MWSRDNRKRASISGPAIIYLERCPKQLSLNARESKLSNYSPHSTMLVLSNTSADDFASVVGGGLRAGLMDSPTAGDSSATVKEHLMQQGQQHQES